VKLAAKKARKMGIEVSALPTDSAETVAEATDVAAGSDSRPSTGSARVVALLEAQRQKHATSVKMLLSQLQGVERALDAAKAKLDAVDEALAAIREPNGDSPTRG
jgi:hypothetical protein